jgi:hypothetical protein
MLPEDRPIIFALGFLSITVVTSAVAITTNWLAFITLHQTLIGAIVGLCGLGAVQFLIADLNRKRDARQRRERAITLAMILYAEAEAVRASCFALQNTCSHFASQHGYVPRDLMVTFILTVPRGFSELIKDAGNLPFNTVLSFTALISEIDLFNATINSARADATIEPSAFKTLGERLTRIAKVAQNVREILKSFLDEAGIEIPQTPRAKDIQ